LCSGGGQPREKVHGTSSKGGVGGGGLRGCNKGEGPAFSGGRGIQKRCMEIVRQQSAFHTSRGKSMTIKRRRGMKDKRQLGTRVDGGLAVMGRILGKLQGRAERPKWKPKGNERRGIKRGMSLREEKRLKPCPFSGEDSKTQK